MSAYNIVYAAACCPNCGEFSCFEVQFKYGNTWQKSYQVGDELSWGGNEIGVPELKKVKVEAVGGPCAGCGADGIEFDVEITNNIFSNVIPLGSERAECNEAGYVVISE